MYYTVETLSPNRARTPEGFLLCKDVRLARTGTQIYGPNEVPVRPAPGTGYVQIRRDPEEVFHPDTIASAIGKPFTLNHPPEMEVTPETWRTLSHGHILNPHRGEGSDSEYLLGDVLITTPEAIAEVEAGKREVSCGYSCDYDELGDEGSGIGRQRNIIINHLALVEQGRCGPSCAIGDQDFQPQEARMRTTDRRSIVDKMFTLIDKAFRAKDETEREAVREEMAELSKDAAEQPAVVIHNHHPNAEDKEMKDDDKERLDKLEKKVDDGFKRIGDAMEKLADKRGNDDDDPEAKRKAEEKAAADKKAKDDAEEAERKKSEDEKILGSLEMEAPAGTTGDALRKANDSALFADGFQETVAAAEILAPGIRVPTFDAKASPRKTFDAMCGLRRQALEHAMQDIGVRNFVETSNGARAIDVKTADCNAIRPLFFAAAAYKAQRNNDDDRGAMLPRKTADQGKIRTPADLNDWADKKYRQPTNV